METNIESLHEKRMRTLENDPQYFGGYLNMVRHNIFNISNHVAQIFGQSLLRKEDDIVSSFMLNNNIKNLNWNHVYSKTMRHLAVIKVFDFEQLPKTIREATQSEDIPNLTKDFAEMSRILRELFKDIREFRNDYTHYYSTSTADKRKTQVSLQTAEFLNKTFKLAIEYTKTRMKDVLKEEDFSLAEKKVMVEIGNGNDNRITTEGLVFLICMFLEREQAFQFIGKVKGLKGTQYDSFIATREVLMGFCVKLPHDKFVSEDFKQALTLDMINELNRCPKTLYNVITEEGKKQFRPELDMENRRSLFENSTNQVAAEGWDETTYEEYLEELTKRIRHENRFAYFAMRYIDENNVFSRLRFHIDLGKFELANYNKILADEETPRRIVENVRAFGKLSELNDQEDVYALIDPDKLTGGFEQFAPHYNAVNNKIGLLRKEKVSVLVPKQDDTENIHYRLAQPLPDAFLSLHELPKIILLEYLKKGEVEKIINEFIELNNIKLLDEGFVEEVKSKLPREWDEFQKKSDSGKKAAYSKRKLAYLQSRKSHLNKLLEKYGLNDKQIPSRILNYWLNIVEVDNMRSFSDRVKLMKRDCKRRLSVMEKHRDNPKVRIPKVGEMATFLAKDIVDMVINEGKKQKITSFYYDKMQECLAFYADEEKKDLFGKILEELSLLEKDGHPFLSVVMERNSENTSVFYQTYLEEKAYKEIIKNNRKSKTTTVDISWMKNTFYTTERNEEKGKNITVIRLPEDTSNIPFTIRQWAKEDNQTLGEWLKNIATKGSVTRKAIDLPTNLFDSKLCELLGDELEKAGIKHDPTAKYNELMKKWWREIRKDETQEFYKSDREYIVYGEMVSFSLDSKQKFKDYYRTTCDVVTTRKKEEEKKKKKELQRRDEEISVQVERKFKKAIAGTEKEIRLLQEEDRLMLLMVERMMDGEDQKNMQLGKIDKLLNDTVPIKLTLNFDENGKIIPGNKGSSMTKTIVADRKRKNYTELRKYRYDRRLSALFGYHPAEEVDLDWLKIQLAAYDKAKQEVFDTVFELEKQVITKDSEGVKRLFKDDKGNSKSGNIQHTPYLAWLKEKEIITEAQEEFLKGVRNAFSHNQFPQKENIPKEMELNDDLPFAAQIAAAYKQKIEDIKQKIQSL